MDTGGTMETGDLRISVQNNLFRVSVTHIHVYLYAYYVCFSVNIFLSGTVYYLQKSRPVQPVQCFKFIDW